MNAPSSSPDPAPAASPLPSSTGLTARSACLAGLILALLALSWSAGDLVATSSAAFEARDSGPVSPFGRSADLSEAGSPEATGLFVCGLRWGLLPLGVLAVAAFVRGVKRERARFLGDVTSWLPLRVLVYTALTATLLVSGLAAWHPSLGDETVARPVLAATGSFLLSIAVLAILELPALRRPIASQPLRLAELALWTLVSTALLLESALGLTARLSRSPVFWERLHDESAVARNVERSRGRPGDLRFGHAFNSKGYYDDEFFAAGPGDLVIALLADSFGVGTVPHAYNFATVAERILARKLPAYRRVAIHDFGMPSIDPPEYAFILRSEALSYDPSYVLLCVFVGNDLARSIEPAKEPWFLAQDSWIATVAHRLGALRQQADLPASRTATSTDVVPDFVKDPSLEKPSFPLERFLEFERWRFENVCDPVTHKCRTMYRAFTRTLDTFHSWLGRRLVVVLVPDEFQVDDALYATLSSSASRKGPFVRDLPQKLIGAHCRDAGIALIDLLPPLREARKGGRVYHLQDSHWNARGNAVAGETIAAWLVERVQDRD